MVSQFISPDNVGLLSHLDFDFPSGIHAIGRLDNNSEGLLILTTNKKVTRLLFQGEIPHKRTYLLKVKNEVNLQSLDKLRNGVTIRIKGGEDYVTTPCEVEIVEKPADLPNNGFDAIEYFSHTWLQISLTEGKFHQVRKMVASVNHRCIRLIRISIEGLCLDGLQPGEIREIEENIFFEKLKIDNWND